MEWYWWVIIAAAIACFVLLKVKVGNAWMKKRQEKKHQREKTMEDEE
jgi:hypothetical protein